MSKISLAKSLALVFDNLTLAASIIECTEETTEGLSPLSRQGLDKVHTGLAMAIKGMEYEELQALIMQKSDLEK
ncbi:hypothetical protein ACSYAD_34305 [Acaryochloris marina NIES-2412]|uniref:hypothetical protein n=1 Tax=Acaryochloris marina TaxID=155978 RepID=UPI004058C85C